MKWIISFVIALFIGLATLSAQPRGNNPADIRIATHAFRFERDFKYALLRVMDRDEGRKLWSAIIRNDNAAREQVLRAQGIFTLNDFLNRIGEQLRPIRTKINDLEKALEGGDRSVIPHINALEDRYSRMKMSYPQLAAVIYFYQWYDPVTNALIAGQGITRAETRVANQAVRTTRWGFVPRRKHGVNAPKPRFDRSKWTEIHTAFSRYGILEVCNDLWSQLVNIQGRHQTYRHIEGFTEDFYREIRKIALQGDPNRARRLFFSSLANTQSQSLMDRFGTDLKKWPKRKRFQDTTARLVLELAALDKPSDLIKFFGLGELPPSIVAPSTIVSSLAIKVFQEEGIKNTESVRAALRACLN